MSRIPLGRPPHLSPGTQRGSVSVESAPLVEPLALEDELEGALVDATGGDPPGKSLGKRLERVARAILLKRGLGQARVEVRSGPEGTFVKVWLGPSGPLVREIRVEVA